MKQKLINIEGKLSNRSNPYEEDEEEVNGVTCCKTCSCTFNDGCHKNGQEKVYCNDCFIIHKLAGGYSKEVQISKDVKSTWLRRDDEGDISESCTTYDCVINDDCPECGEYNDNCSCCYCNECGENEDAGDCVCCFCEGCDRNKDAGMCECDYCNECGNNQDLDECECVECPECEEYECDCLFCPYCNEYMGYEASCDDENMYDCECEDNIVVP